jgi:hypothetical protein
MSWLAKLREAHAELASQDDCRRNCTILAAPVLCSAALLPCHCRIILRCLAAIEHAVVAHNTDMP